MRRSEIEQDIILETSVAATARQAHRLYSVLQVIVVVCIRIFIGHLMSPFFSSTHAHVHITLSFLTGSPVSFGLTIFYLSVYIAVLRGRSHIAPCLASLGLAGTKLARCLKDLRGDVEAKEGVLSGSGCGGPARL